jgi:hypothetical protein
MRVVKLGLLSLLAFFLLVFFMSLLMPSHIRISRAINIAAQKDSIKLLVTDLTQWQHWNVLVMSPEVTGKHYTDSSFTSDQLQVIKQSLVADTMKFTWKQHNGRTGSGGFFWHMTNNITVTQWYFDFHLGWYPWEKFSSLLFESQLGPPMEKSLANLKDSLEKKQ